jgi:hypothetical protein
VNEVAALGATRTGAVLLSVLFASGGDDGAVLRAEVLQQLMFAQHAGLHAFALLVFERTHVRADIGNGAQTSVSAHKNENGIRANMRLNNSRRQ